MSYLVEYVKLKNSWPVGSPTLQPPFRSASRQPSNRSVPLPLITPDGVITLAAIEVVVQMPISDPVIV